MKTKMVIFFLLMTLLLAACGGGTETVSLAGTNWVLEKIGGQAIMKNTSPALFFGEDGQVGGNASCNQFGGSYKAKDGKLTFGPLSSTLMACVEPGVMEQESAYLAALSKVASYSVEENRLILYDADGAVLARFVK